MAETPHPSPAPTSDAAGVALPGERRAAVGRVGPLTVTVRGERPFTVAVARELEAVTGVPGPPDLEVVVDPAPAFMAAYRPTRFSAKTHMSFDDHRFSADEPVRFLVEDLWTPDRTCRVAFDDRSEPRIAYLRRRFGRTIDAHPALSYALLWWVVHVRLTQRGASSLHAGVVDLGGRAVAIAGTGGSGKTSVLFDLLERPGARYLAEDLAIVGADGSAHPSPKAISIYSSDLHAGSVGLRRYVRGLPAVQRLKWTIHDRVMRTTPMVKAPVAAILPPDRIGTTVPLGAVVYLVRTSGERIQVHETTADDLARRCTDVAWREHKRLLELVRMIRANAPADTDVPSVEQLTTSTTDILRAAFEHAACRLVEVPARTGPGPISAALDEAGLL